MRSRYSASRVGGNRLATDAGADEFAPFLAALRRRGDEAQFTQVIAAVAGQNPTFAGDLARVLVEASGNQATIEAVPKQLRCRPERRLADDVGASTGRVDLIFEDDEGTFTLLTELKLHSGYGSSQLERYLQSLDALPGDPGHKALIAVTKSTPQIGEKAAALDPRWLGSVRWADVFDRLLGPGRHARGSAAPR